MSQLHFQRKISNETFHRNIRCKQHSTYHHDCAITKKIKTCKTSEKVKLRRIEKYLIFRLIEFLITFV